MSFNLDDFKTDNYKVVIVEDPEHPTTTIYGLMNRHTEVIEYYDNLLPRAYEALQGTEKVFQEMLELINTPDLLLVSSEKDVSH